MDAAQPLVSDLTDKQVEQIEHDRTQMQGARRCGECKACCTVLAVVEIGKPNNAPCCHLADNGCGIYATRPRECHLFFCDWLLGAEPGGDERHRPDVLGLMFTRELVPRIGALTLAYEVWPGASREPKARFVLQRISKRQAVAVLSNAGPMQQRVEYLVPPGSPEMARIIHEALKQSRQQTMERIDEEIGWEHTKDTDRLTGP